MGRFYSPSCREKLSEKSRMPLQVALRYTERVLLGPFWRSYTGQIYGRNPSPTPFRTVSQGSLVNRGSLLDCFYHNFREGVFPTPEIPAMVVRGMERRAKEVVKKLCTLRYGATRV